MVVPELYILGGKRCTIRPFVAFAQVEGQLSEIAVPLPTLGNIWNDSLQIVRETYKIDVTYGQEV